SAGAVSAAGFLAGAFLAAGFFAAGAVSSGSTTLTSTSAASVVLVVREFLVAAGVTVRLSRGSNSYPGTFRTLVRPLSSHLPDGGRLTTGQIPSISYDQRSGCIGIAEVRIVSACRHLREDEWPDTARVRLRVHPRWAGPARRTRPHR